MKRCGGGCIKSATPHVYLPLTPGPRIPRTRLPMRRMRLPARLAAATLLLAACRDGGDGGVITAGPDDLRLEIVAGKGIFSAVRPPGVEDADSQVARQPITVRISLSPDRLEEEGVTPTGPRPRVRMPAVEVRWRALQSWCQPVHAATPVPQGADSVSNQVRRPTVTGHCQIVVEGIAEGRVFGTDTSVIDIGPGPTTVVNTLSRLVWPYRLRLDPSFAFTLVTDAYGNHDTLPVFTTAITRGAPQFTLTSEGMIRSSAEGIGEMEIAVGTIKRRVELWAIEEMRRPWRLTWACYGGAGADGTQIDSVHYRFEAVTGRFGVPAGPTIMVTFEGDRHGTTWTRGQPARQSTLPNTTFQAFQAPGSLEWSPGQVARSVGAGAGYLGGTLCEAPPGGGTWARTSPVRVLPV